jgi:type VI secretion system protein ImpH
MAHQVRTSPHFLDALQALADNPAAAAVFNALRVSLDQRVNVVRGDPVQWTVADALQALDTNEHDIKLFAALRLLEGVQPQKARLGYSHLAEEDPVRIDQTLLLEFAPSEVTQVEATKGVNTSHRPRLEQAAVGLLGPNGALPYTWTEHAYDLANSTYRSDRDSSFLAWINVIQRRQIGLLYRAWSDSQAIVGIDRPTTAHPVADRLRALAGLQLADTNTRDHIAPGFKMAFAAVLSKRVRSPQPLAAMLSYHFDTKVRVEEFVARWLDIPVDQRTQLGVQFNQLGQDAVAGARVWDCSTRFKVIVGPLSLDRYRQFLPQGSAYAELSDLVSLYVGVEYEWDLVPVLESEQVPYSWLGNEGLLLGWSSWLGVRYDTGDAANLNMHMAPNFASRSAKSSTSAVLQ